MTLTDTNDTADTAAPADTHDTAISFEELTRLALAADPDAPLDHDAVPFTEHGDGPLPDWYMPTAVGGRRDRRSIAVVLLIIASLLMIVASGLCITYGQLTIA